jgi:hypothetical protein
MATKSAAQKQAMRLAKFHAEQAARKIGLGPNITKQMIPHFMQCIQDWHAWFVLYGGRR